MATSLLFIRKLVRDRLGIPMHDDYFPDPLIDANINLAILAVEEAHRWPWNETKTTLTIPANAHAVPVPSDWRATRAIVNAHGTPLEQCVSYDLEGLRQDVNTGSPSYWCIIDDSIEFAPANTTPQDFTHIYYRAPKLLSEDTDIIRLPPQHVGTIVAKASQLCSTREDDRPSAAVHMLEFQEGMARMQKDIRASTRPLQKHIRAGNWV